MRPGQADDLIRISGSFGEVSQDFESKQLMNTTRCFGRFGATQSRRWATRLGDEVDAPSYMMPFGKYAGRTLRVIDATQEGRRYLFWAFANLRQQGVRDMIGEYLAGALVS